MQTSTTARHLNRMIHILYDWLANGLEFVHVLFRYHMERILVEPFGDIFACVLECEVEPCWPHVTAYHLTLRGPVGGWDDAALIERCVVLPRLAKRAYC
jgi:hypothetical protein